jgi:hypothetical protein
MYQTSFNSCELPNCYPVSYDLNLEVVENFSLPPLNIPPPASNNGCKPGDNLKAGLCYPPPCPNGWMDVGIFCKNPSPPNESISKNFSPLGYIPGNPPPSAPPSAPASTTAPASSPAPPPLGGDRDSYGCIMSAGYQWCETLNKCVRSWETPCIPTTAPPPPSYDPPDVTPPVQSEWIEGINNSHIIIGGVGLLLIIMLVFTFSPRERRYRY